MENGLHVQQGNNEQGGIGGNPAERCSWLDLEKRQSKWREVEALTYVQNKITRNCNKVNVGKERKVQKMFYRLLTYSQGIWGGGV